MKLKNKYFLMRHGQALSNVKNLISCWPEAFYNGLTPKGRLEVEKAVKSLKNKNIDLIFSSDLLRTKQTAEMIAKELKLSPRYDKRLREVKFSGSIADFREYYGKDGQIFGNDKRKESYALITKRMYGFLKDIDKKHKGKNILVISHQGPLFLLQSRAAGYSIKDAVEKFPEKGRIQTAEIRELN